jgi:excisionase family DNA binding protein
MKLLTIREAAKLIAGVSPYRVRMLCLEGKLKHHRFGKKFMIADAEIISYFGFKKEEKYDIILDGNTLNSKGA